MNKLKKLLPFVALSLVGMNSVVSAVDDMQVRNLENRVSALEQRRGANGMINPPARPVVKDGVDLWLQAEALYMRATEDSINYGIKQKNTSVNYVDGQVKNVSYDWTWGWRAGIGYNLPHDGWDMILNYTWFRSNENDSTNSDSNEAIYQTWTDPNSSNVTMATVLAGHASGHSHLKFDYLDFQLGREFFVSKWLTLRPFAGARGLWTHRDLKVTYKGGTLGQGNLANAAKLREKFNNHYRGGGLLAGLDTQWGLGMGWSFYGNADIALIYGTQRLRDKQTKVSTTGTSQLFNRIHDNWTTVRTMIDLAFGLRWDHLFCDDAYRIRLELGWEQHLLPGFSRDLNFVDDVTPGKFVYNQGDLAVSGLALQARFDF